MRSITLIVLLFTTLNAYGQQYPPNTDSLLTHDLDEIVVSTGNLAREVGNTVQRVRTADLENEDASTVSELTSLIGSANIQTNSRGETLVYLRNAGERQVALYFNGALLNIPWDNRMNLDLVPAFVIGGMTVAKGVPSVLYGTNALGGAINLTSRRVENEGHFTDVRAQVASEGNYAFSGAHYYRNKGWQYSVAGNLTNRDGVPVAGNSILPFSQQPGGVRTNTDRKMNSGFVQIGHQFPSGIQSNISLLHIDGSFGIAPESHLDPAISRVRFWRYPVYVNSIAILNSVFPLNNSLVIRHSFWYNDFKQEIDSYEDATYNEVTEKQKDLDRTAGTRLVLHKNINESRLSISLNGLVSTHQEMVAESDVEGNLPDIEGLPSLRYRQFIFSAGFEYEQNLSRALKGVVGASFDGISTPLTGDKIGGDPLTNLGFTTGLLYQTNPGPWIRLSMGRRTRFPTLRELYGVALNRFLLNPDLKAESSFVSEISIASESSTLSGEVVVFYSRTFDTIDQMNVEVEGRTLRQRINLDGSRNFGVELVLVAQLTTGVSASLNLTQTHARGLEAGDTFFLTEKPETLGRFQFHIRRPSGLSMILGGNYTGRAYGRQEDNILSPLPRVLDLNGRLAYGLLMGSNKSIYTQLFAGVENVFNKSTLPQLGLPGPGRRVKAGLEVSF